MLINEKEILFEKLPYTKIAGVRRVLAPIYEALKKDSISKRKNKKTGKQESFADGAKILENFNNLTEEQAQSVVDAFGAMFYSIDGVECDADSVDEFLVDCTHWDFILMIQKIFEQNKIDFADKKK